MSFLGLTGFGGQPSIREIQETVEGAITFGPTEVNRAYMAQIWLDGASRDSGSSPTTLLRPGLILGRKTSDLKYTQWSPTATNGSEKIAAILLWATDTQYLNTDDDKWLGWALFGGFVKANGIIFPSGFENYARSLMSPRFVFDDFPHDNAPMTGLGWRNIRHVSSGPVTLTKNDHNTLFTNKGATGSITFNLPAIAGSMGLRFGFLGYAAQDIAIAGPASSTLMGEGAIGQTLTLTGATAEGGLIEVIGVDNSVYAAQAQIGDGQTVAIA